MENQSFQAAVDWLNANQGVLSLVLFGATGLFAWASGILSGLRRRPKFRIDLIEGPSMCSTVQQDGVFNGMPKFRNAISLYLRISNVGSAPSNIYDVHLAYHWNLIPFSMLWLKYGVGWHWVRDQIVIATDFQVDVGGGNVKIYPFLFQRSSLSGESAKTYLEVGESASGIVYFEEPESWGGAHPRNVGGLTEVKVQALDVFGGAHTRVFKIPVVNADEARKFNPSFGSTFLTLNAADEE